MTKWSAKGGARSIVLREMSREGLIASTGKGRSAKWVRKS